MNDQDELFDDDTIDRIANFLPVEARAGFYRELRHCRSLPQNDEMLRIIRAMQYLVLIMVKLPEQMALERERFEQIVSRCEKLLDDVHEFVDEATRHRSATCASIGRHRQGLKPTGSSGRDQRKPATAIHQDHNP